MGLVEHDHMIQAVFSDRPDHSLDERIQPRASRNCDGFRHVEAKLQQLTVDPRRASQRVFSAHLADEIADALGYLMPVGFPSLPIQHSVHGVWL